MHMCHAFYLGEDTDRTVEQPLRLDVLESAACIRALPGGHDAQVEGCHAMRTVRIDLRADHLFDRLNFARRPDNTRD